MTADRDDRPAGSKLGEDIGATAENATADGASAEAEAESAKARFTRALEECADGIVSVRNEIYTTKRWQLAVDVILGAGGIALLILSMIKNKGTVGIVTAVCGVAAVVALILFNYISHSIMPSGILQYTYIDKAKGRRSCYQILSKTRAVFDDGEHIIENNRDAATLRTSPVCPQLSYDFFARMDPTVRIAEGDRETYKGTLSVGEKTYKCSITIKSGRPLYGVVGGCRTRYFDVNNTKEKFVVPFTLKEAARILGIPFPKTPGLYVKDEVKDLTKQQK